MTTKILVEDGFKMIKVKTDVQPEDVESAVDDKKPVEDSGKTAETTDKVTNWAQELKDRIEKNAKLDPDSQYPEAKIRNEFWDDFFNAQWKPDVVEKLKNIPLIKQDIEKLGFNKLLNPIYAFLLIPRVQEFLKKDLLNAETFKAVHNAVAKKYIADSEMTQSNTYNIIYCIDLYKKTPRDMETYLNCQSKVLKRDASAYSKQTIEKNIKIFLQLGARDVLSADAELNDLEEIESLTIGLTGKKENGSKTGTNADNYSMAKVVNELKSAIEIAAALQFVAMSTNNDEAKKALLSVGKDTTAEKLIGAAPKVSKYLTNLSFDEASTSDFVELLVDRLKEVQ